MNSPHAYAQYVLSELYLPAVLLAVPGVSDIMVEGTVEEMLLRQVVIHDSGVKEEAGLNGPDNSEGGTASALSLKCTNV